MRKISIVLVLSFITMCSTYGQTNYALYTTSVTVSPSPQMQQDNTTDYIGIGVSAAASPPSQYISALTLSNQNFSSPPTVLLEVVNNVSGTTLTTGNSPYSLAVTRSQPGYLSGTLSNDFIVDGNGMAAIGSVPAAFNPLFFTAGAYSGTLLGITDPNPSGITPLLTVATNTNNPTGNNIAALTVDYRGYTSVGEFFPQDLDLNPAHLFVTDPDPSGTDALFYAYTNSYQSALYISYSGQVGIGTASPNYPLDVSGNANVSGTATIGNTMTIGSHATNGDAGQMTIDAVGLGSGAYANVIQVSDPAVKAFAINQQCQPSGCTGTTDQFLIYADGHTLIGGMAPSTSAYTPFMLAVNGNVVAKNVQVETSDWSDFVFDKGYKLPALSDIETYIGQNKHLPDVPSECDAIEKGVNLGEMNKVLLQKVEELTLYLIQQQKEIDALKKK